MFEFMFVVFSVIIHSIIRAKAKMSPDHDKMARDVILFLPFLTFIPSVWFKPGTLSIQRRCYHLTCLIHY